MKKLDKIVQAAWFALEEACRHARDGHQLLEKALAAEVEIERDHRRFMRASGLGNYALSVEWSARYQVSKIVCGETHAVPTTWSEIAGYRHDFPICFALAEALGGHRPTLSPEFLEIDYAGDISRS